MVRLLTMLARTSPLVDLDLPGKVLSSINQLREALASPTPDSAVIKSACIHILFRIWSRVWKKTDINPLGDPTVVFLALAMHKEDGSFKSPKDTTPVIARLKYCLRLIMLIAIKRVSRTSDISDFNACKQYEIWFTEKLDSTFNTLSTMQHYASSLAHQERGLPKVVWMDRTHFRTMRFEGYTVEFAKLTALFSTLETDAINIWEKDILMGLPLRIDYGTEIVDNMANHSVGYSFLSDPRNQCFHDRDMLAKAILSDPFLSKQFLTDQIDNRGQPIWKITELQKWLFNYSKFHGVQITSADLKGGAPSRGTEINCIEHLNSRTRQRGLYMIGNHLAIMCQYHKSASITGKDKLIPHSLDAVTSDLVIQDLAIARPFAELAAYICYPNDLDIQHRYHSYLFVNNKKLFDTPQLTNILKRYTLPIYNVGFGVSDWRHISASFRRKICPAMELTVEDDENLNSIQALQSGHSRHTENHIYGITAEALAGAAEDVLPLYLDASTDWQVACQIVPGGHMLPYPDAVASRFATLALTKKIKINYSTPVTTMEQVTERMLKEMDIKLEKHTNHLLSGISEHVNQMFATQALPIIKHTMEQTMEKLTNALALSKYSICPVTCVLLTSFLCRGSH